MPPRFHSVKTRKKLSVSHLGNSSRKGTTTSPQARMNMSIGQIGKKLKLETKNKISKSLQSFYIVNQHHMTGRTLSKKTKTKIRSWSVQNKDKLLENAKKGHKSCPRISSHEKLLEKELKKTNLTITPQFEYELGFVDFLINGKIAVFVDGHYWHNYPHGTKKDNRQTKWLTDNGYIVLRFWDFDIKKDVKRCVTKINEVS